MHIAANNAYNVHIAAFVTLQEVTHSLLKFASFENFVLCNFTQRVINDLWTMISVERLRFNIMNFRPKILKIRALCNGKNKIIYRISYNTRVPASLSYVARSLLLLKKVRILA